MATITGGTGAETLTGDQTGPNTGTFNDVIYGGGGNDVIFGQTANDDLYGGTGSDRLYGGDGNDTLDGGVDADTIYGDGGDDLIRDLDSVRDTIYGGLGNDTIVSATGGGGSDVIFLDGGDDTAFLGRITTGTNESVDGGTGNDTFAFSNLADFTVNVDILDNGTLDFGGTLSTNNVYLNFENVIGNNVANTISGSSSANVLDGAAGNDLLSGEAGNDTLLGGQGVDTLYGGANADILFGGNDGDSVYGDAGADTLYGDDGNDRLDGGDGADTLFGGVGVDTLFGGNDGDQLSGDVGTDSLSGGSGNDTLYGGNDGDTLDGGTNDDRLSGDAGNDLVQGGSGNDALFGGAGADTLYGGAGLDVISGGDDQDLIYMTYGSGGNDALGNETVTGGAGGVDNDTLTVDITGFGWDRIDLTYDALDSESGTITFFDAFGAVIGTLTFTDIENLVIVCFTAGTRIMTDKGTVPVEDLAPGDLVLTRDNGMQPLRWVGKRVLTPGDLARRPELQPVRIGAGALGEAGPERSMLLSPQHRVLIEGARAEMYFGETEVLVPAKHLLGLAEVTRALPEDGVTYVHILFDRHEIVLSDGLWTESFQPAERTISALDKAARDEVLALFPELAGEATTFPAARLSLKAHEARVLLSD